jgi:hypothetical protein
MHYCDHLLLFTSFFSKPCDFISIVLLGFTRFSVEVDCPPSANNSSNQDMDSSSSSSSSSSSPQEEGEVDGLQQSKQEQPKEYPLFFIKPIDSQGQGIEKKKRLEDLGEYYYLSSVENLSSPSPPHARVCL